MTEMTEEGKKLPPVSQQNPAYFHVHGGGYLERGEPPAGEKTVTKENLEQVLVRSLATAGYLPAQLPDHPPSLFITYSWGLHTLAQNNPTASQLERATLIAGEKFAKKLQQVFMESREFNQSVRYMDASAAATLDPANLFKRSDPKIEFVVDQSETDLYYVIASAYDYRAGAEKRRVLLWRTRMTVTSRGVTQEQTLPTIVLSAARYFGKEMTSPATAFKRATPEGHVEIGTATVVEVVPPVPVQPSPAR